MISNARAGSRILGTLRVADGKGVVREFRARFTTGWEGTGHVEVREPPRRPLVRTKEAGERDAHVAGDERCDIKARGDELTPAYRALAEASR